MVSSTSPNHRRIIILCAVVMIFAMLVIFNSTVKLTRAVQSYIMKSNYDIQMNTVAHYSQTPKVIWLMSFPNSGNSFTTALVRSYTNSMTATNYGENHLNEDGVSQPIHSSKKYNNGPFIVSPTSLRETATSKYVLTKVH